MSDQKSLADQLRPGASSTAPLPALRKLARARPSSTKIEYVQFRLIRMNTGCASRNENDLVQAGSRRSTKSPGSNLLSAALLKSAERSTGRVESGADIGPKRKTDYNNKYNSRRQRYQTFSGKQPLAKFDRPHLPHRLGALNPASPDAFGQSR
jgi:hypothetical protein